MLKAGLIALWMKKKYKIPYVVSEHWSVYNAERGEKLSFISRLMTKRILKYTNSFLPVSDQLGRSVSALIFYKSFEVVYNNVDTIIFNYNPTGGDFAFIHVSMMTPEKMQEILSLHSSHSKKKYHDSRLIIVGPETKELQRLIAAGKDIYVTGLLPYHDIAEQMKKADAFILFSDFENLPCVICEALCCGLPVISSNVGGVKEIINETNGILVERRNVIQLESAMEGIYLNQKKYNRRAISLDAADKFSYPVIGKQIHGIYKTITSSH